MVHLYIGNGKGKTTAALGLVFRALGWEKKIYIAQFLKDVKYPSGEIKTAKIYKLELCIERFKDQIHPIFLKKEDVNLKKIKKSVAKSFSKIEALVLKKKFDIIVLDEILDVLAMNLLPKARLMKVIKEAKDIELILTGRNAPSYLVNLADYVSLVKNLKHPFDRNIPARKGIEY